MIEIRCKPCKINPKQNAQDIIQCKMLKARFKIEQLDLSTAAKVKKDPVRDVSSDQKDDWEDFEEDCNKMSRTWTIDKNPSAYNQFRLGNE